MLTNDQVAQLLIDLSWLMDDQKDHSKKNSQSGMHLTAQWYDGVACGLKMASQLLEERNVWHQPPVVITIESHNPLAGHPYHDLIFDDHLVGRVAYMYVSGWMATPFRGHDWHQDQLVPVDSVEDGITYLINWNKRLFM